MLVAPQGNIAEFSVTVGDALPECWPSVAAPGDARCTVFQTREFIAAWQASFGTDPRLRPLFVTVSDERGRPLMLLPLCLERRPSVTLLTFLDQGHADYNAPVLFPATAECTSLFAPACWQRLLKALPPFDVALFDKMPAEIADLPNPMLVLADATPCPSAHGNRLTRPWAEVQAVLPSVRELRSKKRALERLGAVELVVGAEGAMRRRLLNSLVAQKQRRFEETRVPGFVENPRALAFLQHATDVFGQSGGLSLCGLLVGGEITAVQWGLTQGTTFYALMTSFEGGTWAKLSCGRVLNWLLLERLKADGFAYFDQGFGDEPYKVQSCDTTIALNAAEIGQTPHGRLYLRLRRTRQRLRAHPAWERLRQLKWIMRRGLRRRRPA
jgi:CelD/BcsL family acetyltransferase involved in cellulose biosynthesis